VKIHDRPRIRQIEDTGGPACYAAFPLLLFIAPSYAQTTLPAFGKRLPYFTIEQYVADKLDISDILYQPLPMPKGHPTLQDRAIAFALEKRGLGGLPKCPEPASISFVCAPGSLMLSVHQKSDPPGSSLTEINDWSGLKPL